MFFLAEPGHLMLPSTQNSSEKLVCLICLMFTTAHLWPVVPLFDLLVSDDLELVAFSTESTQKTIGKNVPSGKVKTMCFSISLQNASLDVIMLCDNS